MLELYLIIDESGAKSKSDKQESSLKDFGVMAGFIAPENGYNYMKIAAKRIINELEGTYKKTHLTDLNLEDKSKIIKDFYRFAKINRIPWIYTAIYTQGFFEFHNFEDINKGSQKKESMHSELFKNNIGKAIAFAKDHFPKESMDLKITVISDNISKGIIKDFYNEIENIKPYLLNGEKKEIRKFYNKETNNLDSYEMTYVMDEKNANNINLNSISLEILIDNDATFISDILNNTLYKHIKTHLALHDNVSDIDLNGKKIIQNYPLFETCYGYSTENQMLFADAAFHYRNNVK